MENDGQIREANPMENDGGSERTIKKQTYHTKIARNK
jgi:hypothetical protein